MNDTRSHAGRVAVITGAAQGIGQAICLSLAARGALVVAVDRRNPGDTLTQLAKYQPDCAAYTVDISDPEQVAELGAELSNRFARCDIVVNNAAIDDPVEWNDLSPERWHEVMSVNLHGPMYLCKSVIPLMRRHSWGRIVSLSSGSVVNPMGRFVAYRASKMGIIGFTRALATEVGQDGITANVVSPGVTRTPMVSASLAPDALDRSAQVRAIPRVGEPEDIADVVAFLTGEDGRFVTGQTLMVNGGAAFG